MIDSRGRVAECRHLRVSVVGNSAGKGMNMATPVHVVFRKWKKTGEVIALFPHVPWSKDEDLCMSYMHVGQHGAADYRGVIRDTVPAKPDEYAGLLKELGDVGYRNLIPVIKARYKSRPRA